MLAHWRVNQVVRWHDGAVDLTSAPPAASAVDLAVDPAAALAAAR
jgi:hypothetical protein